MPISQFDPLLDDQISYGRGIYNQRPKAINVWEVSSANIPNALTATFLHTVFARSTSTLLVMAGLARGFAMLDPTVFTYNGVSLTKIDSVVFGTTTSSYVGIWYMSNPPIGSANVVMTWAGNVVGNIIAVNLTGVHQTAPVGAFSSSGATAATSRTLSVNVGGYDLLVDALSLFTIGAETPGAGQTEFVALGSRGAFSYKPAAGFYGSMAMNWTFPSSQSAYGVYPLQPA